MLDTLDDLGVGSIVFSPLAQGMLTPKYLGGVPEGSRAAQGKSLNPEMLSEEMVRRLNGLNEIAAARGQTLAQMALAWALRGGRVTTALIGASKVSQIEDCVGALDAPDFTEDELTRIDALAVEEGVNLWAASSEHV